MKRKGQGCGTCGCCGSAFARTSFIDVVGCVKLINRGNGSSISLIEHYQKRIDPKLKKRMRVKRICKYHPTCSEYTKQSIKKYGSFIGTVKGIIRLIKCNPFSSGGYDPVR